MESSLLRFIVSRETNTLLFHVKQPLVGITQTEKGFHNPRIVDQLSPGHSSTI